MEKEIYSKTHYENEVINGWIRSIYDYESSNNISFHKSDMRMITLLLDIIHDKNDLYWKCREWKERLYKNILNVPYFLFLGELEFEYLPLPSVKPRKQEYIDYHAKRWNSDYSTQKEVYVLHIHGLLIKTDQSKSFADFENHINQFSQLNWKHQLLLKPLFKHQTKQESIIGIAGYSSKHRYKSSSNDYGEFDKKTTFTSPYPKHIKDHIKRLYFSLENKSMRSINVGLRYRKSPKPKIKPRRRIT